MHPTAMRYMRQQVRRLHLNTPDRDVLELGGRDINGTVRQLFDRADRYVSVDICEGPSVDIVADAGDLDLGERFGIVASTELLEHTPRGADIVAAAFRHLLPGGFFLATMAGPGREPHSAAGKRYMEPDEWYRNVEPDELETWLKEAGFDTWEIDQLGTDLRCTARLEVDDVA